MQLKTLACSYTHFIKACREFGFRLKGRKGLTSSMNREGNVQGCAMDAASVSLICLML